MSANSQTASPPSNAKEVSFSVGQLEYLHIFNQRKLVDIVNDLGPMLMEKEFIFPSQKIVPLKSWKEHQAQMLFTAIKEAQAQMLFTAIMDDLANDLGPMLMADFGDGVKAAYPAKKVEEVLRKHLGISPAPVHRSPFTVHSSK